MRNNIIKSIGLVLIICILATIGFANPQQLSLKKKAVQKLVTQSILTSNEASKIKQKYRNAEDKKNKFQANLTKSIEKNKKAQILQKQAINSLSETDRIKAFILGIRKMRAEGLSSEEIHQTLQQRFSLRKTVQSGSISGTVNVDGQSLPDALVLAFDLHGYFAGEALTNFNGTYTISDLSAGDYRIITQTGFVDEFYNDVSLNDFENWRSADLVNVPENGQVSEINFDLASGGVISGVVTDQGTGAPIAYNVLFIKLYDSNNPSTPVLEGTFFTDNLGNYSIPVGDVASYKIHAMVPGYKGEFYNDKPDWVTADLVEVVTPGDTVKNVDFALEFGTVEPPVEEGNVISGTVTSQLDGSMLNLVLVFAFDTADTSIAGFTLTGGLQFGKVSAGNAGPNYFIGGLNAGSYIVMATDLLSGVLTGQPTYSREFYQEVSNPDDATPVTFATNTDTAKGIDFTLDMGGLISGKITDESGAPLKEVMVLALKGSMDLEPFFTNLDIGFATTDSLGNYQITGISSGEYFVRTITLSNDKYAGVYLDEWYDNVYNLLAYDEATKVVVTDPNETANINFQLENAGAIAGKITASDGTTPVNDVAIVVAIDTSSSLPQLATFEYADDNSGDYMVSMLEPGDFKLYAFVDPESDGMYLSEFYDGSSTYEDADVVSTALGDTTKDVNFTLEQGGMIQGFVNLSPQLTAGADTLFDFPVVAYDANTGEFSGAAGVTFSGGFRTIVPAGQYKVVAIPVVAPFAATYVGGGNTYDDPNSQLVAVTSGNVQNIVINLEQANGGITGSVSDGETNEPINGSFVFAYDNTGHAVGAGMSGMDIMTDEISDNPGVYFMGGLRTGNYYVRTFALFRLIQAFSSINLDTGSLDDPFSIFGNLGDLFNGNIYKDEWFDDVAVELPEISIKSVFNILENLRYEEFGLIPFYQMIPGVSAQSVAGITPVSVTDGSFTGNIDFALGKFGIDDLPVSVEDTDLDQLPTAFQLGQSYPNPIHRNELANGVTINFELIDTKNIAISVYNVLGQKVASILNREMPAGFHNVQWDGKDNKGNLLPSGVYFYDLNAGVGTRQMKKLVILR